MAIVTAVAGGCRSVLVTLPTPTSAAAETCAPPALTQLLDDAKSGKVATKPASKNQQQGAEQEAVHSTTSKTTTVGHEQPRPVAPRCDASRLPPRPPQCRPWTDPRTGLLGSCSRRRPPPDPSPSASRRLIRRRIPPRAPTDPERRRRARPRATGKPTDQSDGQPDRPSGPGEAVDAVAVAVDDLLDRRSTWTPRRVSRTSTRSRRKMTADVADACHGLSFDGIVDLPTQARAPIKALQFSMDSSTSTPFELQPVSSNGRRSTSRAASSPSPANVKFYCTEIKGNLLGRGAGRLHRRLAAAARPAGAVLHRRHDPARVRLRGQLTADNLDITVS